MAASNTTFKCTINLDLHFFRLIQTKQIRDRIKNSKEAKQSQPVAIHGHMQQITVGTDASGKTLIVNIKTISEKFRIYKFNPDNPQKYKPIPYPKEFDPTTYKNCEISVGSDGTLLLITTSKDPSGHSYSSTVWMMKNLTFQTNGNWENKGTTQIQNIDIDNQKFIIGTNESPGKLRISKTEGKEWTDHGNKTFSSIATAKDPLTEQPIIYAVDSKTLFTFSTNLNTKQTITSLKWNTVNNEIQMSKITTGKETWGIDKDGQVVKFDPESGKWIRYNYIWNDNRPAIATSISTNKNGIMYFISAEKNPKSGTNKLFNNSKLVKRKT